MCEGDEGGRSMSCGLLNVKHKVLVLSGKGGVGKSTVSSQLAFALVSEGLKVGLLDVDLCGPSIPHILGLQDKSIFSSSGGGWVPIYADADRRLAVMSLGFLMESVDSPVIWRGPKKTGIIRQFLERVIWSELDYLIVDTPPGTSDEHISVCEILSQYSPDGAIIVTTPQNVSLGDVKKEITFCKRINLPIIGIIENMSGFKCPCCNEITNIFSTGGGEELAKLHDLKFIGKIPIDPTIGVACDSGENYIEKYTQNPSLDLLKKFAKELARPTPQMN